LVLNILCVTQFVTQTMARDPHSCDMGFHVIDISAALLHKFALAIKLSNIVWYTTL